MKLARGCPHLALASLFSMSLATASSKQFNQHVMCAIQLLSKIKVIKKVFESDEERLTPITL